MYETGLRRAIRTLEWKGGNHPMNATATQLDNRNELLLRLAESRSVTDDLFRIVRTEALYDRPIPERHRIVFYIGHLEAFDWNLIAGQALGLRACSPGI